MSKSKIENRKSKIKLASIFLVCACLHTGCGARTSSSGFGVDEPYTEHLWEGDRVVIVLYDDTEFRGTVTAVYDDGLDVQLYPSVNEEFKWADIKEIRVMRRGGFQ